MQPNFFCLKITDFSIFQLQTTSSDKSLFNPVYMQPTDIHIFCYWYSKEKLKVSPALRKSWLEQESAAPTAPISGRVDRASATETEELGSIPVG